MINNIDTGDGKVKFSYRIIVVVSDADPISRMMDSLKANEKLTKWAAGHRMTLTTKFLYKIMYGCRNISCMFIYHCPD